MRPGRHPRPDLIGPVVLNLAGILLLVLGWAGAQGQDLVGPQLPYVNLAVGGVILAGAGNMLHLLTWWRALRWRRLLLTGHRTIRAGSRPAPEPT
jgi:hypothetical protein